MLKIATWNINSVRLRLSLIEQLLRELKPDILCLQETKVPDPHFPESMIRNLGFPHLYFCGEKSYNGVAILSQVPLSNIRMEKLARSGDCRHLTGVLPDGTELHNFYVPAGGDIPDRVLNPKFDFKLNYLDAMADWFRQHRTNKDKLILVGDLNVAPLEHDVWSHKQLLSVVSHTPVETKKLNSLQQALGWIDTSRHFVSHEQKLYSWWSYRNQDWRKSNRGRRLDHIWVTPVLEDRLKRGYILKDCRDWTLPSDHVPVVMEIDL